jgi:hypothetical protein
MCLKLTALMLNTKWILPWVFSNKSSKGPTNIEICLILSFVVVRNNRNESSIHSVKLQLPDVRRDLMKCIFQLGTH